MNNLDPRMLDKLLGLGFEPVSEQADVIDMST